VGERMKGGLKGEKKRGKSGGEGRIREEVKSRGRDGGEKEECVVSPGHLSPLRPVLSK